MARTVRAQKRIINTHEDEWCVACSENFKGNENLIALFYADTREGEREQCIGNIGMSRNFQVWPSPK